MIPFLLESTNMEQLLTYIGFAFFFIPLIVGLSRWRRLSARQNVLVGYIGFVILFSIAAEFVGRYYGNNLLLYHIYTFVEFSLLLYLFRSEKGRSLVFLLSAIPVIGAGLWSIMTRPFEFPDLFRTAESLVLIGFSLMFFYNALRHPDVQRIERTFIFWISGAVLLYFTGTLLLDIFSNYIASKSDQVYFTVWTIHTIFNMILYALYAVALLCTDPIPPLSQSSSSAH